MLETIIELPKATYSEAVIQDACQYIRGVISWKYFQKAPLNALPGQRVTTPGYRWTFWTPEVDYVGNPRPNPAGTYSFAEIDEAVGPGYVVVHNEDVPVTIHESILGPDGLPDATRFRENLAQMQFAAVWSQAFSLPNRTTAAQDRARIDTRVDELSIHWNAYGELTDAERYLAAQDLKGAVRSAASSVDAAIRFYCAEWNVPFPQGNLGFDAKIETMLAAANRPSFRAVNSAGLTEILHLYRARNSMHTGDNRYNDSVTGQRVNVDLAIATNMVREAAAFRFWLDSQA